MKIGMSSGYQNVNKPELVFLVIEEVSDCFRCEFTESVTSFPEEDVNKAVCDAFDELQVSVFEEDVLHPSEECHKQSWIYPTSKIFDIINKYHVFCHLCNKHVYSRSVPTDINSFFQHHINTQYHRECRSVVSHSEEMIVWNKKWLTGNCKACQISDMTAFVIDQDGNLTPSALFREHVCDWDKDMLENNEEFLRKMKLLKNYCNLSLFREKFIEPLDEDEGSICMLCCLRIPWSGENVKCHLKSKKHLNKFFSLVKNKFNLSPNELLNGYNLEMVTRWIYRCVFKHPTSYSDYQQVKLGCSIASRSSRSLPPSRSSGHYCPAEVEKLLAYQQSDFCDQGACLLCSKHCEEEHLKSKPRKGKEKNLPENFCGSSGECKAPHAKIKDWLKERDGTIEKYKLLKEGKDLLSLKVGRIDLEHMKKFKIVKGTFFKKLALIEEQSLQFCNENFFCEICDLPVPVPFVVKHATDCGHLYHRARWQELEKMARSNKFFEPFQRIKGHVLCLLCGILAKSFSHFYTHLKGTLHKTRFKEHAKVKENFPFYSAIAVENDLSVVCYCCDSILLKRSGFGKFQENVNLIRKHWPCPLVKKNKNVNKIAKCSACGSRAQVHNANCPTNLLDFKNVEIALKEIVKACESVIFKRVIAKIKRTVRDMEKTIREDKKQKQKTDTMEDCGKPDGECECGSATCFSEHPEGVDEDFEEIKMGCLKNEKADYKKGKLNEAAEEKETEILVISGLDGSKKILNFLMPKLGQFGKIEKKYYRGKSVIVEFGKKGIAGEVAASKDLLLEGKTPVTMSVELRKLSELEVAESQLLSSPPDLLRLLGEPLNLLDFVADLTVAAIQASESLQELEREKCYPFGSRLSGLMSGNSDLDVFLDCGGMYEGMQNTSPYTEKTLVYKMAQLLRKSAEVRNLIVVPRARVPIVSFVHRPTSLRCDVSFKNALSVYKTLLIKFLLSLNYQAKFIVIFLKHWVKVNGIHGPPFFSSYAITLMAIFYFQQLNPPMMPTVEELQKAFIGRRLTIGGWDCSFSENATDFVKKVSDHPFQVILLGFFSYYANFEYDKFVISPVNGKPVPREAFLTKSRLELPLCYKRHILNYPEPLEKLVSKKISLCVIDPFDLSHVVTKSFTPNALHLFKQFCHRNAKALKSGILRMCFNDESNLSSETTKVALQKM